MFVFFKVLGPLESLPLAAASAVAWGSVGLVVSGASAVTMCWAWWRERGLRRELDRRLSKAEARAELAEAVFNACPEGILIMDPHDVDEPLAIVACNEHACEMHQWSRAELVGHSVNKIEARPDYWPDHAAVAVLVNEIGQNKVKRGEAFHRRRDGVLFPLEYSNSLVTIRGRDYVLGFDRDTTKRKQIEQALRVSEEHFRLIIEASPTPIQLLDPHDQDVPMRIVTANRRAAEMHGVSLDEFIGRSMGEFEPKPVTAEEAQAKVALLRSCSISSGEGVHRHKDGHEFPIEFTCSLIVIGGRELIVGCDHDIGERRRLDAELAESRRLRAVGAMVGGVAHEFNNLLTPVRLYLEQSPDAGAKVVLNAVEQARELTRRILAFGRGPEVRREVCDAVAVGRECVELIAKTIDRRIEIEIAGGGRCPARIARNDLSQIVMNLLLNSRDTLQEKMAAERDGWRPHAILSVIASTTDRNGAKGDWIRLRVSDNGMGISPEVQERIFEPFFTTKPPGKGTGLGLATVWHLVLAAEGQVAINSQQGRGSTIDIYLKAGPTETPVESSVGTEAEPCTSAAPASAPAAAPSASGKVLLVEDNGLVSAPLIQILRAGGYDVTHIENGADACAAVVADLGRWDRVLTDLNLPGLHGAELVTRIRAAGYSGKIVVYSGMVSSGDADRVNAAGVSAILQKPFPMKALWDVLR